MLKCLSFLFEKIEKTPRLAFLTRQEVETIHETALDVLENCGVYFDSEEALKILKNAGCQVDESKKIVKFPRSLVL
ncbi:MAG TPA: hypothetical protein DCE07_00570 [Peptococcaceae bacterium]|nr:hypothetical protein [Peptococcaceae bacterium]